MLLDVSAPLRDGLVHYPDNTPFHRHEQRSVTRGDRSTNSELSLGAHTGTHVDAPAHFLAEGHGVDGLDLEACLGPCWVADLTGVEGAISAADLEAAGVPADVERLLGKTRNSGWTDDVEFREDFCAYDASAARWCVDRGLRLVGIDYLSVEPRGSGPAGNPTHKTLLAAGVVVLEGLELAAAEPGAWELIALPLRVVDGDGAPARVLLRR